MNCSVRQRLLCLRRHFGIGLASRLLNSRTHFNVPQYERHCMRLRMELVVAVRE
jgi:hypothetical protein